MWSKPWSGKRVLFHCDNHRVVHIWLHGSSSCPNLMVLVRCMFFTAANKNYTIVIKHILDAYNVIADALSHAQMPKFHALAHWTAPKPTPRPAEVLTIGLLDQQQHSFLTKASSPHHNAPITHACHGIRSAADIGSCHRSQPQSHLSSSLSRQQLSKCIPDAEGTSGWHQRPSSTRRYARLRSKFYSPFLQNLAFQ